MFIETEIPEKDIPRCGNCHGLRGGICDVAFYKNFNNDEGMRAAARNMPTDCPMGFSMNGYQVVYNPPQK